MCDMYSVCHLRVLGHILLLQLPCCYEGAILMTKLVNELERTGARYGLQTMCIGHGQATATIIERVGAASSSAPNIKSKL